MISIRAAAALAVIASSASAQSSLAACGEPPDSTARQTIVSASDLKVCLLAMRADPADSTPRRWATRSHVVILETQQPGDFRRLALETRATAWTINGRPAAFDSTAELWQRVVVDVLDAAWATKRLGEMADELRATDIPLTTPDSAKAELKAIDRQIQLLQAKMISSGIELERTEASARRAAPTATGMGYYELAARYARGQYMGLQASMQVLKARRDIVQLQLDRLDPSNPGTIARQSKVNEVSSRLGLVEAEFFASFSRLRGILAR